MASYSMELELETCWCGMPFMLSKDLRYQARNRGHTIYCPLGHTITWKETEETRLRRERDRLKQDQARLEDEKRWAEQQAQMARERADKAEKATKRLKKRASAGTCPCCNRTFANMAQHMKHQHPELLSENGTKVVPLKRPAAAT